QIEKLVTESEQFKLGDETRRELAELRNQAETLLYTTTQALDGYSDLIDAALLDEVKRDAIALRALLDQGSDLEAIRAGYNRLEGATYRIAESMYGEPGATGT
ncbi:MAG TPA: Hsp70 family protein, partial [Polyangiaceae bacterium]|nr:Hsp70 family protein [Polyangiaceae bacterium]